MKTLVLLVAAYSPFAYATPIDYSKVNLLMRDLSKAMIQGDELVEYAEPQFDPRFSDLSRDRLRYMIPGVLKQTPWSPGRNAQIRSGLSMVGEPGPEWSSVRTESTVAVLTDVLPMVRYGAKIALRQTFFVKPAFEARIRACLVKVASVKSLTDLFPLLEEGRAIAIEVAKDGGDAGVPQSAESIVRLFTLTTLTADRNSAGEVLRIGFRAQDPVGLKHTTEMPHTPYAFVVDVETGQLTVHGFARSTHENQIYRRFHERMQEGLSGYQAGNEGEVAGTRKLFRKALASFKSILTGTYWY